MWENTLCQEQAGTSMAIPCAELDMSTRFHIGPRHLSRLKASSLNIPFSLRITKRENDLELT